MSLSIETMVLGEMQNNTYLLVDRDTSKVVVVDPALGSERLLARLEANHWEVVAVWLTHAHFDHIAGVSLLAGDGAGIEIGLHPEDLPLYKEGGAARFFGIHFPQPPEPSLLFKDRQLMSFAGETIEVRHTPGHCPGHVVFHLPGLRTVLCGDLLFRRGIGRTDLPGGSTRQLFASIDQVIFKLPPDTRLLSGHGPETTVDEERRHNPFLA